MEIEVVGAGGTVCKSLFCNALEAVRESGRGGTVSITRDIQKIMKYGIVATPALIINGVVAFSGELASPEEIFALLQPNLTPIV